MQTGIDLRASAEGSTFRMGREVVAGEGPAVSLKVTTLPSSAVLAPPPAAGGRDSVAGGGRTGGPVAAPVSTQHHKTRARQWVAPMPSICRPNSLFPAALGMVMQPDGNRT